jgi:hypothetical protein
VCAMLSCKKTSSLNNFATTTPPPLTVEISNI